ncbi:Asp-tRNA(Asn)/Glu-tRNA(Gln) amidotransferase subunit GatC [Comamonas sp. JC664]|uniref:Asp-tRNA(Asn)/Glu-tRNA(Gln) amidotransferase subunit GatC n=1 Tax=Comamonas sp. JC664 TaxID=2801917 RepID=UPI00174A2E63|nr:Asp-tRNA(Asn)/Glu-tRNA(Gln) amidotransferase subunit GatC [Comamonas sp. JC664]MBL0697785.1 Asp-tRNA(Asn)/Glu-tRNA(Gln) amidotransferase subunit GatC [Comamonas sp. JC664]GHG69559.1 aspartyl/glutamyl-tRNA(Asn/Gln) amidotransferase subunit C [Comamonas sp. KCTC 72670]
MALTLEQVRHVATLARLSLTPEEEQRFTTQLSAVLDAVEQLQTLDVEAVEPTCHATLTSSRLREDVMRPSLPPEKSLANAPAKSGTAFAVPKIIE